MLIILFLYFITVVYRAKYTSKCTTDYLSIENTTAIKGIFILMVFLSHFNSYITLSGHADEIYIKFFRFIGQAMVALFLFYSGYGIMESIKRKGNSYISSIPKKRLLHTLFNFDCAVLLYLILGIILGDKLTIKHILLSLIGWDSLGNSNWYIFVILVLYLLTFIVFKLFAKAPHIVSVIVLGVAVCGLILVTHYYKLRPVHWYDTMACYVFGMAYSLHKEKAEAILSKNIFIYIFAFLLSLFSFCILKNRGVLIEIIVNLIFCALVILTTMMVTFKNRALLWAGDHLFEIYILQRLPMIILKRIGLADFNVYLYFGACLIITVLISIAFRYITTKLYNLIIR